MSRIVGLLLIFLVLISVAGTVNAIDGTLSYIEGMVLIRDSTGGQRELDLGDFVSTGDTVMTGDNGFAEIDLGAGSSISIEAGTVFTLGETTVPEGHSGRRGFFRVLLGAVGFKFRTLTQEPLVGTPLSVCSVRGTEFTVFAAPEGSALYVVTDGLVDVESGGRSVSLSAGQGVRAEVGVALGEPFEVQRGWVKYEEFAADALARFDQDPLDALEAIRIDLVGYLEDAEAFAEALEVHSQDVAEARRRVKAVLDAQGEEQARELAEDILDPLYSNTLRLRLTFRHHVLSIRSLRRYVIAGLYVRTRVKTWADDENALWSSYKDAHDSLLELYEQRAVTLFEEEDL